MNIFEAASSRARFKRKHMAVWFDSENVEEAYLEINDLIATDWELEKRWSKWLACLDTKANIIKYFREGTISPEGFAIAKTYLKRLPHLDLELED